MAFKTGDMGGLLVRHTCDNPPCCNPDHLLLGTPQDNANDMVARGRVRITAGEAHPNAKLTAAAVREIRTGAADSKELARKFGVHRTLVSLVRRRLSWRHVV
jgi:hypothetical protein